MSSTEQFSDPLLEIRNLSIDFQTPEGSQRAVNGLNLSLQPGEVMGLVGESGSGKSITAKSIMRLLPGNALLAPNSQIRLHTGQTWVDVMGLHGRDLRLVRGGQVSMIFQEPMASFAPAIRVGDQIVETIRLHTGADRQSARRQGIELFDRVGIREPEKRFDQYVFELSGGMRQRAMIAMALATRPRLLIADEPTTALDVTVQAQVLELMLELREQFGMAMLFITHDLGVISRIADNITVMQKGDLVESGSCDRVLFAPTQDYTKRLLDALPHLDSLPAAPADKAPPLVTVRDLSIVYPPSAPGQPAFKAVPRMNLELPAGQIIGLVGESGSGKTSLGKALLGAAPISSGEVCYRFETPLRLAAGARVKRKALARVAQLVFQDPYSALNPRMTVRDIIAEPLLALGLCRNNDEVNQRVVEVAKRCQIEVSHLRRFPHAFSGGQRQRISIARALVVQPRFIVADEAVAALDVSIQAEILALLKSLRDEMGLTILFISHDLSVVANLCDHVCVMQQGRLVEQGSVREIFLHPQEPYTRALINAIPTLQHPAERQQGEGISCRA